jgi:uncharacterized protein (TIGR03382 family)
MGKLLVSSVPIGEFPGPFQPFTRDRWVGYPAQRRALLDFLEDAKLPGVFFLSGDFHMACLRPVAPLQVGAGYRLVVEEKCVKNEWRSADPEEREFPVEVVPARAVPQAAAVTLTPLPPRTSSRIVSSRLEPDCSTTRVEEPVGQASMELTHPAEWAPWMSRLHLDVRVDGRPVSSLGPGTGTARKVVTADRACDSLPHPEGAIFTVTPTILGLGEQSTVEAKASFPEVCERELRTGGCSTGAGAPGLAALLVVAALRLRVRRSSS